MTETDTQAPGQQQPANGQGATSLRLAEAFRHELDQVIQPVLETIRGQQRAAMQQANGSNGEDAEMAPGEGDNRPGADPVDPPVLTLTVKGQRAENAMDAALDMLLDGLFSSDLRHATRKECGATLKSLITSARRGLPKDHSLDEERQDLEQRLDEMVDGLFSDDARAAMQQKGQAVIQGVLSWDVPRARSSGMEALQGLERERLATINTFWKGALSTLLKASRQASEPKEAPKSPPKAASNGHDSSDEKMPQTVLRSDKRAQDIWKKAYDKAAGQDGQGSGAQKAAYDALKAGYEKKGDRWVKKETAKSR